MADKRQVRRSIRQLERVKTWQLFLVLLLMLFVAATFLRLNNIGMVQRRDAVLAADKSGDMAAMGNRLYDLQRYVSSHMNADMGTIYLEGQYQRDSQKVVANASGSESPNGNVNEKADAVCKPRFSGYSQAYLQCFVDELEKFAPGQSLSSTVNLPKVDNYRHSFASPVWSPDFAGFSVLICIAIAFLILVRLASLGVLRLILKMKNRDV